MYYVIIMLYIIYCIHYIKNICIIYLSIQRPKICRKIGPFNKYLQQDQESCMLVML